MLYKAQIHVCVFATHMHNHTSTCKEIHSFHGTNPFMYMRKYIQEYIFFSVALQNAGHVPLILEVSRSHTHKCSTICRNPLDEWSALRRDLYLPTHNNQTSMPLVGFESTIPAGKRPQTYALDHAPVGPAANTCKKLQVYSYNQTSTHISTYIHTNLQKHPDIFTCVRI
jgi:hypothetical protein